MELRDPPPRVHATDLQLTTQLPPRYDTFEAFMPAVEGGGLGGCRRASPRLRRGASSARGEPEVNQR